MFQSRHASRLIAAALAAAVIIPVGLSGTASASEGQPVPHAVDSHESPGPDCPFTSSQLAHGQQIVANARLTLATAQNSGASVNHSFAVPGGEPIDPRFWGDASDCALALADIRDKEAALLDALASLAMCTAEAIFTGESCDPEKSHLDAVAHELMVALYNLERSCPWL